MGSQRRRTQAEDNQGSGEQHPYQVIPLKEMIGQSCRDCINIEHKLSLTRKDCRYDKDSGGHRIRGTCIYCQKTRPIVKGLKLFGRIKAFGR